MYDVAIVGAGPAGATLARLIGRSCKVLLIDKRELLEQKTGSREKCCGGLIAPDAQHMLGRLGLGVPGDVLVGPQLFTVRTLDIQNKIEKYYQRHYINIDRQRFDAWLVSLVPPEVDIRCGVVYKFFERTGAGIKLRLSCKGREFTEETRLLIGADGAYSMVRKQLAPQVFGEKYVAIQEWFEAGDNLPYFSAIFDREITDFYSWTIPKERYLLVGAAIPNHQDAARRFLLLKGKLRNHGFTLKTKVKRQGCYIIRPQNAGEIYLGEGNVLLIGEAAGWISPTSAEGLSYSFRSALALAQSIKTAPEKIAWQYARGTRGLRLNITAKVMKGPFMYQPMIRRLVLKSGIKTMNIVTHCGQHPGNALLGEEKQP